ncbi:hypothetical protein ACFU6R_35030, partial [Streptomyces sp. NPDC057499]
MTEERKVTGRLRDTGRCATCFESFNPACPRAVLDESTQETPRQAEAPVRPVLRPRATAGSDAGAGVGPRVVAQPPATPRPRNAATPSGSAGTPSGSDSAPPAPAPVRDPRRPRTGASPSPRQERTPWQERTAPRSVPGAAAPAPGTPG